MGHDLEEVGDRKPELVQVGVEALGAASAQHEDSSRAAARSLRTRRHDVVHEPLDDFGLFDVVHVRFLLHHLGRKVGADVAGKLAALVAPGGRILLEEPMATARADPGHAARDTFESIVRRWYDFALDVLGLDIDFGLMLPQLLVEDGMAEVGNDVRGFLSTPGDPFNRWLNTSIASAQGALDAAFDGDGKAFRDVVNEPWLWSTGWLVVSAWGTRPS